MKNAKALGLSKCHSQTEIVTPKSAMYARAMGVSLRQTKRLNQQELRGCYERSEGKLTRLVRLNWR